MTFWRLDQSSRLRDYCVGFALTSPFALLLLLLLLHILVHVRVSRLVLPSLFFYVPFVLGGAPFLRWAHKRSLRTGSPRPIALFVAAMTLWGFLFFMYFVFREEGFDVWPACGAFLVVIAPLAYLCWHPPQSLYTRLAAIRQKATTLARDANERSESNATKHM